MNRPRRIRTMMLAVSAAALLSLVALTSAGCDRGASDEGQSGTATDEAAPGPSTTLVAPAPAPAGEEGERVVQHLESMHHIAAALPKHCDEMARDLTTYLELARADFEAAKATSLDGEARARIAAAYDEVSRKASKCMNVPQGREFGRSLLDVVGPLRSAGG